MAEPQFYQSMPLTAPPAAGRTGIKINWNESGGETVPIQRGLPRLAPQARLIYLKPSRWQGHEAQVALDALDQRIYAAKLGKLTT